jgi:CheY-like chemotaxis protein
MSSVLNILVVEDDPNDVALLRVALENIIPGVIFSAVSDGVEAVEYLSSGQAYSDREKFPFPDVVLLDLKLPLMDGFEVLRWIRQQPTLKALPVVGLTGSFRHEDAELACKAGASFCVLKSQGFRLLAEKIIEVTTGSLETDDLSATPAALVENPAATKIDARLQK